MRTGFLALLVGSVLLLPGCVMTTERTSLSEAPVAPQTMRHGRVEWIRQTVRETQGNPAAGAAAGAVVGGLLGQLITGHAGGTLFGATTGAMIGASASQVHSVDTTYDVAVSFDDGATQVFTYRGYPPFQAGQSVTMTERGLVPSGALAVSRQPAATTRPPYDEPQANAADAAAQPSTPQPGAPPATLPAVTPAPPVPESEVARPAAPAGEWSYTQQYGWVWMPYGAQYTFTPDYVRGDPYMYVYYPAAGWTWVQAPWLWGWGPMPYFRVATGVRFDWYGHGWGDRWRGRRPAHYRGSGGWGARGR